MSSIHLTRSAVAASVCAVLAITTAGTAAALTSTAPRLLGVARDVAVPVDGTRSAVRSATTTAPTTARAASSVVANVPAPTGASPAPSAKARPAPRPPLRTVPTVRTVRTVPTVTIRRYTDAPGSQQAIDACHLVLWTSAPLWLAGHNYCGYQWLAYVRTGTVVSIRTGRAAGRYVVTGHRRLSRQSGSLPRLHADLVLQTCVGRSTGLTLARRLG